MQCNTFRDYHRSPFLVGPCITGLTVMKCDKSMQFIFYSALSLSFIVHSYLIKSKQILNGKPILKEVEKSYRTNKI